MLFLIAFMVIIALLDVAATFWGVDSREESHDPRRSPYPVAIQ
jgi:hypothetical protein